MSYIWVTLYLVEYVNHIIYLGNPVPCGVCESYIWITLYLVEYVNHVIYLGNPSPGVCESCHISG